MLPIMDERFLPIGSARRPGQGRWPTGDCHRRMPRPERRRCPEQSRGEMRSIGNRARRPLPSACRLAGAVRTAKPNARRARSAESCPRCPPVRRRCDQFRSPVPEWTLDQAQSALPVGIDHGNPRRAVVDVKPRPHCSPGLLPVNVGSGKAQLAKRNAGPRLRGRDWTMGAQPVRELAEGHADRRCR